MQAAPVAFIEPSTPSTLPAIPLVRFCMILAMRAQISHEGTSGAGLAGADALGLARRIRLRFLAPPRLPRLLFCEATERALGRIGNSPSLAGAAPPPAGDAASALPDGAAGPPAARIIKLVY